MYGVAGLRRQCSQGKRNIKNYRKEIRHRVSDFIDIYSMAELELLANDVEAQHAG